MILVGREVVRLGTDSSPWAQNDNSRGTTWAGRRMLLCGGVFRLGSDSSPGAQHDMGKGDMFLRRIFVLVLRRAGLEASNAVACSMGRLCPGILLAVT